jgi:hypothetical protein
MTADNHDPDQVPANPSITSREDPLSGGHVYDGKLPVLQWEINPQDANANSGTKNLMIEDWEVRLWWQVHPDRVVYASMQAMKEDVTDHEGDARPHPVGRSEAVNLVYDIDRKAVVAIYGTVRDFQPFVDAFYRGYLMKN